MNSTKNLPPPLLAFMARWLARVVPGLKEIRVVHLPDGRSLVKVRDVLGWRPVGSLKAYQQLARALGAVQS